MKALVYTAVEKVEMREVAEPLPKPGQALVQISASGICGSDLTGYLGHSPRRQPGLVLGHEAVGTLVKDLPGSGLKAGQKVCLNPLSSCGLCPACKAGRQNLCATWSLLGMDQVQGTFASQVSLDASQVLPFDSGVPDERVILTEPLANVIHYFRTAFQPLPSTLAIFGAGTMGALTVALAKLKGVAKVAVVDRVPERLKAAEALGADLALDLSKTDPVKALQDHFGSQGAEAVVDAVGSAAARKACQAVAGRGARLLFLGLAENESALPFVDMIRKEQTLFTTFAFTPSDFKEAFEILRDGKLKFDPYLEFRPLSEGQEAFQKMAHNPGGVLKMVLKAS